ncbi:cation:proton antiporter [Sphaerisporangium sp. NPDC051011]|uniref:cation:proton antiporter n=1 Tax=Sphaerisporangium sp. NPDC051011 TaxID=3155792 RepID=UPI003407C33D
MNVNILAAPATPLGGHQLLIFLVQVASLLLLALCLGRLAERLKMPAIVGELLTGVILGPSLLGHFAPGFSSWLFPAAPEQAHLLDAVGQIGVLLLVGVTGTHLDVAMLRRRSASALRVSLTGLLIPLALGIALGSTLPASLIPGGTDRTVFAMFLGVAMCVSAIPVIAKTLSDMRLLHRDVGQLTLAAGTVDDAVGWFLLSVVSAAATVGVTLLGVSLSVAYLVGFLAFAVVAGRPLVRRVMSLTAGSRESGPAIATAVVLVLLGAVTTHALGMEPIFGALVVGTLIGMTGTATQKHLAPLRTVVLSVLAPIFIATAGLRMDLTALLQPAVALTGLAVLAIAILGKFAGAYLGARLSRLGKWEAVALGAGMNARGVVEVIVAMTGLRLGVLTTATYTVVILVALITSLMAPPLLRVAMRHITQNDEELLRKAAHESWAGMYDTTAQPSPTGPARP